MTKKIEMLDQKIEACVTEYYELEAKQRGAETRTDRDKFHTMKMTKNREIVNLQNEVRSMKEFLEKFNTEYDYLYKADSNNQSVAGADEALHYFDNSLSVAEQEILIEFQVYRNDLIMSDREAIAFMFTLESFI